MSQPTPDPASPPELVPPANSEFPNPSLSDFKWAGDGSSEVKWAYILATLGLLICPAALLATALASMALQKGHPRAGHAMIYSVLMLTLAIGAGIFLTLSSRAP